MKDDARLDESIAKLLREERTHAGPPRDIKAAMWTAVQAGTLASSDPPTRPPSARVSAATGAKIASLTTAAAVIGGLAGASLHAHFAPPKLVYVDRPIASAPSAAATPAPIAPTPPIASPSVSSAAPSPRATPRVASRDAALMRERGLLEMAQSALARGDHGAALRAIASLEAEFPKGQFVEEREVLAIQALASANDRPAAHRRAAKFHATYPTSPFKELVEEAVDR